MIRNVCELSTQTIPVVLHRMCSETDTNTPMGRFRTEPPVRPEKPLTIEDLGYLRTEQGGYTVTVAH
jgi:hypothetical protein